MRRMALGLSVVLNAWCVLGVVHSPEVSSATSRQTADRDYNPTVSIPAYTRLHPRVLFDEAHNNADTVSGRYNPFVRLATSDGYLVRANTQRITAAGLRGYKILVVVNAAGPSARSEQAAFDDNECNAIRDWVGAGGSLLLVVDHLPFSSAMSSLAERFEINITKGYTVDSVNYNVEGDDKTELVFTREKGLIGDHPITRGRKPSEQINRIITFTGTSVQGPQTSTRLLKLSSSALDVMPPKTKEENGPNDHTTVSAQGRAQALALEFGRGRVVAVAEAAALTAQVTPGGFRFGMSTPGYDDRQFALNILHWLSRALN